MTTKRAVLRTGFATVIGLSLISTYLAYRIQGSLSKRTVEIHRKYVQQQSILGKLRRVMWMGGIAARDFFLNTAPNSRTLYLEQIRILQNEMRTHFTELQKLRPNDNTIGELQGRTEELYRALVELASAKIPDARQYGYVQQEIVPKRDSAGRLLRELEQTNESSLTKSEEEFTATRRAAAQGLLILLAIDLLLAILVSRFSLRYSENLEQQMVLQLEEVSAAKSELEKLSARLMEIQEEERTRLSRELHDEIVQTLALLRIEITQAQQFASDTTPQIKEHLDRMRGLAERTLQTVRNITLLLRPSLLDDLGLGPALQWLTEDFRRRTHVRCEYIEDDIPEDLPEAIKTCVYRVTQEALHNCEKHAQANNVKVHLGTFGGSLVLEVRDDGVGLRDGGQKNTLDRAHFGILGMRERAANLGGTLNLESTPGSGLRITLTVPLKGAQEAVKTNHAEALA